MFAFVVAATSLTTIYSDYPVFAGRGGPVEAYTDKGPIVEMIVRCPGGTGIMSYSKSERVYCSSKHRCMASLDAALEDTCGAK